MYESVVCLAMIIIIYYYSKLMKAFIFHLTYQNPTNIKMAATSFWQFGQQMWL